jgi:hypothetical protein
LEDRLLFVVGERRVMGSKVRPPVPTRRRPTSPPCREGEVAERSEVQDLSLRVDVDDAVAPVQGGGELRRQVVLADVLPGT